MRRGRPVRCDPGWPVVMAENAQQPIVLSGPAGFGGDVEGDALVTADGFSARYDLNPATGVISRESHQLFGQSIVGKILVFDFAKGGVATSWRLLDLVARGTAPSAMIFNVINPVMVQGAVVAGIPIMAGLRPDPLDVIQSGDRLQMCPRQGRVELHRSAGYSTNARENLKVPLGDR